MSQSPENDYALLSEVVNKTTSAIIVVSEAGIIDKANQAALDLLGESSLQGRRWVEVISKVFRPRNDDGHEISTRDGKRLQVTTVALSSGQLIQMNDLTETRLLQDKLSHMERLSSLGRMAASLAHQIRTPLSAAMLYAANLGNANLQPMARKRFQEKLVTRLEALEAQVSDILMFARSNEQTVAQVDATQLVEQACNNVTAVLTKGGAQMATQLDEGPMTIMANSTALTGALSNLIANAVEAGAKRIILKLTRTNEAVIFSVANDGPKIPDELKEKIFEPFYTSKSSGTGLGLAVVSAVTKVHQGILSLDEWNETFATVFNIAIPLFVPEQNETIQQAEPSQTMAKAKSQEQAHGSALNQSQGSALGQSQSSSVSSSQSTAIGASQGASFSQGQGSELEQAPGTHSMQGMSLTHSSEHRASAIGHNNEMLHGSSSVLGAAQDIGYGSQMASSFEVGEAHNANSQGSGYGHAMDQGYDRSPNNLGQANHELSTMGQSSWEQMGSAMPSSDDNRGSLNELSAHSDSLSALEDLGLVGNDNIAQNHLGSSEDIISRTHGHIMGIGNIQGANALRLGDHNELPDELNSLADGIAMQQQAAAIFSQDNIIKTSAYVSDNGVKQSGAVFAHNQGLSGSNDNLSPSSFGSLPQTAEGISKQAANEANNATSQAFAAYARKRQQQVAAEQAAHEQQHSEKTKDGFTHVEINVHNHHKIN